MEILKVTAQNGFVELKTTRVSRHEATKSPTMKDLIYNKKKTLFYFALAAEVVRGFIMFPALKEQ